MRAVESCLLLLSLAASSVSGAPPVFSAGENLSFPHCGEWDRSASSSPPWAADVRSAGFASFCPATLLSNNAIVSTKDPSSDCDDIARIVNRNEGPVHAHLGTCFSDKDSQCARDSRGVIVKVVKVTRCKLVEGVSVFVWKTDSIQHFPDFIWPVCIFNRGDEHDSHSRYFAMKADLYYFKEASLVPADRCLRDNDTRVWLQAKGGPLNLLCVANNDYYFSVLLNFFEGRYYWRGSDLVSFYALPATPFVDILPFVHAIARAAAVPILPVIPPPKGFEGSKNLSFPECGRKETEVDAVPHVVRGRPAKRNDHPWHAEIRFTHGTHGFCGGSLISDKAVLTAAHCFYVKGTLVAASNLSVSVGLHNAALRNELGIQTATPGEIIIHPEYGPNLENDIALLLFDKGFRLTSQVRPVCLWNGNSGLEQVVGEEAVLAGWGYDEEFEQPDVLQAATLPIRSHLECYLLRRRFTAKYLKPGKNFCAGYLNGTSSCNGDSGGGLVLKKDGRWFVRGMSSFGRPQRISRQGYGDEDVCDPNHYSIFTDVANYADWILPIVQKQLV